MGRLVRILTCDEEEYYHLTSNCWALQADLIEWPNQARLAMYADSLNVLFERRSRLDIVLSQDDVCKYMMRAEKIEDITCWNIACMNCMFGHAHRESLRRLREQDSHTAHTGEQE